MKDQLFVYMVALDVSLVEAGMFIESKHYIASGVTFILGMILQTLLLRDYVAKKEPTAEEAKGNEKVQ